MSNVKREIKLCHFHYMGCCYFEKKKCDKTCKERDKAVSFSLYGLLLLCRSMMPVKREIKLYHFYCLGCYFVEEVRVGI